MADLNTIIVKFDFSLPSCVHQARKGGQVHQPHHHHLRHLFLIISINISRFKSLCTIRFISEALLYEGIWEEGIVTNVLKAAKLYEVNPIIISIIIIIIIINNVIIQINQDAVFLDLGSNLGVYSLLVAQLRHSAGDQRFDTFYLILIMIMLMLIM